VGHRVQQPGPVPGPPGRAALRRVEAEAGAGGRPDARAARAVPGRAHGRHRPRGPPRAVEPALRAGGEGRDAGGDDALHGRGGALRDRGLPLPLAHARLGQALRADAAARGHARGHAARRGGLRAGGGGGDGPRARAALRRGGHHLRQRAAPAGAGGGARRAHGRDLEAAAGAAVHVRPIEPSLEDVFVRLTRIQAERREREAQPAGATA